MRWPHNGVDMEYGKLDELDYSILDEGVRDIVRMLREKGLYQTTDSGDGSKFGYMECALPFPHVYASLPARAGAFWEAHRMKLLLPNGWEVELTYSTADEQVILFAFDSLKAKDLNVVRIGGK